MLPKPPPSSLSHITSAHLTDLKVEHILEAQVGPYAFDFFIPSHNLLIELNGDYWHSLPRAKRNDASRATYIARYFPEYRLVTIWESAFLAEGRVRWMLERLLGLTKPTLVRPPFAELTTGPVTVDAARAFYRTYIGTLRGGRHTGLYWRGELIGVCSFSAFQRKKQALKYGGNASELSRFCLHPDYQVKNLGSWFMSRTPTPPQLRKSPNAPKPNLDRLRDTILGQAARPTKVDVAALHARRLAGASLTQLQAEFGQSQKTLACPDCAQEQARKRGLVPSQRCMRSCSRS